MPDVSEEGVNAFLDYLYLCDITAPNQDSNIAFELFQLGHKYGIQKLEDEMKDILLWKPDEWFDLDMIIQLYLFARNVDSATELKLKAVKLIKLYYSIIHAYLPYFNQYRECKDF